ncbi:ATP-dependent RNA helicase TDRD9 isoform X2 [Rhinatrema bivittatum]|uniref:ATP-dependent RNA helicase TDRD9 isoform X2 n=1 Tax=Rhinatrema bivittatum TaxID=194408 RepID=UPI0011286ADF|nr:ATP-dependent RNA helicase TDRD9 isoform X2 [Rhinatrema bivittatum]
MLKKLSIEQINDWFTIGKNVANIQLLGELARPPYASANADLTAEQTKIQLKKDLDKEYVEKYRLLEEQDLAACSTPEASPKTGSRSVSVGFSEICVPDTSYQYPDLPITKCKEELISLIETNSVVIVRGATGSGKSTQLPQFILDYFTLSSSYCNIVVTQPRKIGASSIARWICEERHWKLGGTVGYQVGLDKFATKDTRLIYMTTGVLLQKIVGAKSLSEFTHIFIDEVHERTEDLDFLLLVVRKLLRTNSRFVKVILMSATINCEEFANYFAVPILNKVIPAYVFEVEGKPYSVEEYYLDDLKHINHIKVPAQYFEEPVISKEMYEVAVSLIQLFDDLEKEKESEKQNRCSVAQPNSVLVFLPGLAEINFMHELLTNMVLKRLHVYPLHSSITLEEQNNVFVTPVTGYRKIILSTNIAESSVTVLDVKYVIDFCLTRTLVSDEDTNYQSLRLSWASKTNCNQRKGRAGRVSKGYCYRLVSKAFWRNFIPENVIPEMLRCPLGSIILKVKLLDMGEPRALLATALSPPNCSDIERTILLLKEVGALAVSRNGRGDNPYDGELTFLGRVLAQLPVDLQLGKLIVLGHVFGCLEECLIIAAALSLKNFFAMPYRQYLDGYRNKMSFSGNSRSDCIALVNAFKTWQTCRESGELRRPKDELEWGRSNYFQIKRVREVAELFQELRNRVQRFGMYVNAQCPAMDHEYTYKQRFILQVVMAGAFYPNYFTFGQSDEEMAVRELAGRDPKTTVMLKNIPPYGFLYRKQIQSLFRQCGQVKSIVFDGSKVNVDFQKQTVDPVQASFSGCEQSQILKTLHLSINVTEVVEVGHFWGFRIDERNLHILRNLTGEINQQELLPLPKRPHPDLMCLAPFADLENQRYYRAQILYISGDSAEVFFVDYGNRAKVSLSLLRNIPSYLLELPFQALEFKICKMRPSAKSLVCGEQWSSAASQHFASLVNGCALVVKVYSMVHSVLHVDVYRHSGNQEDRSIRDMLIAEGFAEPAEESYESKQNHELLKDLSSSAIKADNAYTSCHTRQDKKYLLDFLLDSFSANKLGNPNCKVVLHGPFNPYEIRFHSMTRVSRFRCVCMEKESINSVLVNDAPEDVYQRMLVAASLSVNASGSTMLLRETSLMPNIPGLPALLSMLFAPVMELRVDQSGREFTGTLCGLGCNTKDGTPVFPEHDLELTFDVRVDVDDIVEINIIRTAINNLVCSRTNDLPNLCQERTAKLQEEARQKLLNLICKQKPREIIIPKWHEKPYEWNQVDPKFLIEQYPEKNVGDRSVYLYQLHKLIMLNP